MTPFIKKIKNFNKKGLHYVTFEQTIDFFLNYCCLQIWVSVYN